MTADSFPDTPAYGALLARVHEIHDLEKAAAVLAWDRDVNMPSAGLTGRIQQMTTLSRLIHSSFTSEEMGALIESAAAGLNGAGYDTNGAALIRVLRKSYADATKLPTEYVMRRTAVSAEARSVWEKARAENDFASFRPWLEQVVTLAQEAAELYGYQDDPYDALIDKYETEAKTDRGATAVQRAAAITGTTEGSDRAARAKGGRPAAASGLPGRGAAGFCALRRRRRRL